MLPVCHLFSIFEHEILSEYFPSESVGLLRITWQYKTNKTITGLLKVKDKYILEHA